MVITWGMVYHCFTVTIPFPTTGKFDQLIQELWIPLGAGARPCLLHTFLAFKLSWWVFQWTLSSQHAINIYLSNLRISVSFSFDHGQILRVIWRHANVRLFGMFRFCRYVDDARIRWRRLAVHCLVESCWFGSVIRCGSDHFEHNYLTCEETIDVLKPVETCWNYWCVGELPLKKIQVLCEAHRTGDIQWHPGSFLQRKRLANGLLDRFRHVELGDRERMGERMDFMGKVLDISWLLNIIHWLLNSGCSKVVLSIRYLTLKACLGGLCQKLLALFWGQGYLTKIDP